MQKNKLIRITTVPMSLEKLLEGQLSFMQQNYEVIAISSEPQKLQNLGEQTGVRTFAVDLTREITPFKDLRSVAKLYRFFKKEKPLIVHTHTPKAGISGMLAAKLAGVPIRLHTVAGLPEQGTQRFKWKILKKIRKLTFSFATQVYPNSFKMYELLLQENFASKEKMKVIGNGSSNGIDTVYFDPLLFSEEKKWKFRKSLKIPETDVVFVFVGRLVGDKGINELVAAFKKLNKKFSNTSLLLVGPLEQDLDPLKTETAEAIKSHAKIFETGYQPDVRPYLACADVLSFPSYREGFPNVVMQAGAMGLPCIVTDINGCNEIVEEGVNGIIIPSRSEGALLGAMQELLENSEKRHKMSTNARKQIREKYERSEMWKALLKEYKNLEVDLQNKK